MNNESRKKLLFLGMQDIIDAIEIQEGQNSLYLSMSFDDRINAIVDYIYQKRYNDRILRRIKNAKLRYPSADIADIYYKERNLDEAFIRSVVVGGYIATSTNIIIQGPTGSGKTFLASAIAKDACRQDIKTFSIRLPDLIAKREEEKGLNREKRYLNKLASFTLLIIDEWLIHKLSDEDIKFIYELIELRYGKYPTIFVSQYKVKEWHSRLGGGTHADSIMDRIVHNSIRIEAGSVNMREIVDKTKNPLNNA